MKVVIILPTYNERENIGVLLDRLHQQVKKMASHDIEFLVVDDNSPDDTAKVVEKYTKKSKKVFIISGKKDGLGKALLRGMKYAIANLKADYIVQMDADLSHDPKVIPKMISCLSNSSDMAVGSRYIPGGSIPANWGIHRKIYSIFGNAIVRYGLGCPKIHDWTGGFRGYKKKVAQAIIPNMGLYNGYLFQIAFLHHATKLGIEITEVPIHFTDRQYGRSKIVFSEYIYKILEYIIKTRIEKLMKGPFKKFLVVGTIGFIINTFLLEVFVSLGFHPSLSTAIGAECAIVSNFILNNYWTFSSHQISGIRQIVKFLQFNTTSLGALIIQAVSVWIGTYYMGVSTYRIWYIIGVGIGLIWNYTMYSRIIWKTHK
ncbi:glycosyltransferase [Patescibacteria group bacterium]